MEEREYSVYVNGRLRGRIFAPVGASRDEIDQALRADERISSLLENERWWDWSSNDEDSRRIFVSTVNPTSSR